MSTPGPTRRTRVHADLTPEQEIALRSVSHRYFRDTPSDAIRAGISVLSWLVRTRESGRQVIAVAPGDAPARHETLVVVGLEELLDDERTWLVERPHPWRRQLWIKGRKIPAGDLARTAEVEGWSAEEAAQEFDLPVEAVRAAQAYLANHRDLVLAEEAENHLALEAAVALPT